MNRIAIVPLHAALLLACAAVPAAAQGPQPADAAPPATATASPQPEQARQRAKVEYCPGSRLKRSGNACSQAAGRSYDADSLRTTGKTDIGEALRMMDPAVR